MWPIEAFSLKSELLLKFKCIFSQLLSSCGLDKKQPESSISKLPFKYLYLNEKKNTRETLFDFTIFLKDFKFENISWNRKLLSSCVLDKKQTESSFFYSGDKCLNSEWISEIVFKKCLALCLLMSNLVPSVCSKSCKVGMGYSW